MPAKVKTEKTLASSSRLILTINSGSSSVKFSLYRLGAAEYLVLRGELDRIGVKDGVFRARDARGDKLWTGPWICWTMKRPWRCYPSHRRLLVVRLVRYPAYHCPTEATAHPCIIVTCHKMKLPLKRGQL